MFCSNCGIQLGEGVNFCPNCGAPVKSVLATVNVNAANQGNMVMLLSLGDCARATAAALFQQLCGYTSDEALLISGSAPITVARGLTDAQARYLAQAFAEYGMEVSVYDGNGWRDWESNTSSVWDQAGELIAGVASALGLISMNNRISRDMMHRWDYPHRFAGTRPPVYRLNSTLRSVPVRRVPPVRPPVHHAPPPPPPRPAPAPRPAPPPVRPAAPARPAAPVRPAPPPTPRPAPAPAPRPAPQAGGRPGNYPGNLPGGKPGGGTGRRG